jgi:dTDP-4-amino-4,6-dideoxygalactose transaminase
VYHLFPVLSADRDGLQAHLAAKGIETLIHYPVPIPHQPALASAAPAPCPVADRTCAQVLSLPVYPSLTDDAVSRVLEATNSHRPAL